MIEVTVQLAMYTTGKTRRKPGGMSARSTLTVSLFLCACLLPIVSAQMDKVNLHIATFNMNGASGEVHFWEMNPGPAVTISVGLVGLAPGNYTWSIHEKPMLYGQRPSCDAALLGGVYAHGGDLTAAHNTSQVLANGNWSGDYTNHVITLTGPQSITGRTLVLQEVGTMTKYCAQVANSRAVLTAVARFDEPFAGTVTFRQERDDRQAVTSIFVELYNVIDPSAQMTYSWRISSNSGFEISMDLETRCERTNSEVYNPTGDDVTTCVNDDPKSCPIGDLSGKFDDVTVEPIPSYSTYYVIDTNLPLSGEYSVLGKSLVFSGVDGVLLSCAQITELLPKSVKALFSVNDVSGTAMFHQNSPYDVTKIEVDLKNLRAMAGGFHVHVLPPPPRTYASDEPASSNNVAGHFNPYEIGSAPQPGFGTNDQYEVGDLSGKFGLLTGHDNFNETFYDWNLPLYGQNSVIGRSLVIHKSAGDRWVYASIGYPTQQKTVKAVFTSPAVGKIVFRQDVNNPDADTSIYIEMAYADGTGTTYGHNWHVHKTAVGNDYTTKDKRCASCEGHFNPFGVRLDEGYAQCSPEYPLRCELGDLAKMLGQLTITTTMNAGSGKLFFTATRLPLSGAYSVTGRSIVIHETNGGGPRIACAGLLEIPPTESTAELWSDGPVSGDVTFKQDSDFDPVQVHINIAGLSSVAGGWHVHKLPIDGESKSAPCSSASVQGHYNPFGIIGSPPSGTQDMYEMGDLSGKFGSFSGIPDTMTHVYHDTNSALAGSRSIIGRSMVIHKSEDGSRWVCATLDRKTHEDDFIMRARADVTTADFTGYLKVSQTRYHTGALSDTTVEIGLYSNNAQTDIFYWNFRPGRIMDGCLGFAEVFNPYGVMIDIDYDTQCDTKSQFRCAVGDMTGKNGNISSTVKRAVFTDVNLPLSGRASVMDVPFHLTSTNTGQLACSTLQPDSETGRAEYLTFPTTTSFDPYKFRQKMRDSMNFLEMWQVVAVQDPVVDQSTGCSTLKFYLIGPNADEMHNEFKRMEQAGNLGEYSPTSLCKVDDVSGAPTAITSPSRAILAAVMTLHLALVVLQLSR
ncbi:uncharacterized protein LOC117294642 isoform X1 [Asterias rubens]|uniref:uncharacterized protein LOC117294642 isoform X1 n=1 Tax=Asterias rubens TaxID=7604 RepID=UPI001455715D|nr:uncharacterized protein LOC117294642 isoform X1 [Asterias rubens]